MQKQVIKTAPSRIKVGTYLTKKGLRLKREGASDEVLAKYTKNRYKDNPDSKPFKTLSITAEGKAKLRTRTLEHGVKVEKGVVSSVESEEEVSEIS